MITYYCPLERCRFVNRQKGRCTLGIVDKYGILNCPNIAEIKKHQKKKRFIDLIKQVEQ